MVLSAGTTALTDVNEPARNVGIQVTETFSVKRYGEAAGLLAIERRCGNFREVEQPWTEGVALGEARRCLRCDYRESACERNEVTK